MEGAEVRAWLRVRTSAAMKPSALLWYRIDSLRVFEHTAVSSATSSDILCKMYSWCKLFSFFSITIYGLWHWQSAHT